jgi:hypothetical protein
MDPQAIIQTAANANASQLGLAEATQNFKLQIKNGIKIQIKLNFDQQKYLETQSPFALMFPGVTTSTTGSSLYEAIKQLMTEITEKYFAGLKLKHFDVYGTEPAHFSRYRADPRFKMGSKNVISLESSLPSKENVFLFCV